MLKERSHVCGELRKEHVGQKVVVQGWAAAVRDRGGMAFVVLRDRYGTVQITVDERASEQARDAVKGIRLEYVVQVSGTVSARDAHAVNETMDTGEIEILADDIQVLAGTRPIPFALDARGEASEETRLRYRYLDLRRPELQSKLIARAKAMRAARNYLDSQGFLDVETPILTKATPEGARDYLVPSRVHPSHWYALPQSPQIFKQILMVSDLIAITRFVAASVTKTSELIASLNSPRSMWKCHSVPETRSLYSQRGLSVPCGKRFWVLPWMKFHR